MPNDREVEAKTGHMLGLLTANLQPAYKRLLGGVANGLLTSQEAFHSVNFVLNRLLLVDPGSEPDRCGDPSDAVGV